jgi:hypothetical protein
VKGIAARTAAAAALTAVLALAPVAQAGFSNTYTIGGTTVDATFAEGGPSADDPIVIAKLESLIRGMAPGSSVYLTVFKIDPDHRIERALREMQAQGRHVYVFYDKLDDEFWTYQGLRNNFDLVKKCDRGCIPQTLSPNGNESIMHTKMAAFSSTRAPDGTYKTANWVSSSNLTGPTSGGSQASNNSLTWYGDPDFDLGIRTIMFDMLHGPYGAWGQYFDYVTWPQDNPDTLGNGLAYSAQSRSWSVASPDVQSAMWSDQFSRINVPASSTFCEVDVMQAFMGGDDAYFAALELQRIANQGCVVRVLVNRDDQGNNDISWPVQATLCDATGFLQVQATRRVHDKVAISRGTYNGLSNQYRVWAGSHNMSDGANKLNDELMVQVDNSSPLYDAYHAHFMNELAKSSEVLCYP